MTPDAVMRQGAVLLQQAGVPDPLRDVRVLWRAAPDGDATAFMAMIEQRAKRVPVAQIIGYRDFYNHRFIVTSDVLDPRPDTETLVIAALQEPFRTVIDLGTGSGCILLSLIAATSGATGVGTDLSQAALDVAALNRKALQLDDRVTFVRSDWFAAVDGKVDLIVSNPPYIAADEMDDLQPEVRLFEPRMALTDEADGLGCYRIIVQRAPAHLNANGRLLLEIGPTQAAAVCALMKVAGFVDVRVIADLDGRNRVVAGRIGDMAEQTGR